MREATAVARKLAAVPDKDIEARTWVGHKTEHNCEMCSKPIRWQLRRCASCGAATGMNFQYGR